MNSESVDTIGPPASDEDAIRRFAQYERIDPLPSVPPALLNSGDIYDYARITGMIYPFPGESKLKPASCEVDFLGTVYYIDAQGELQEREITQGARFTLEKNAIAYIYLATTFRLPAYIALRFNLKITQVHRGLLLGTGPLIDPGFCGRLLIPLHNLTSREYTLYGGDGLIWVEFTKLSPHRDWSDSARGASYDYVSFPSDKRYFSAQQYLKRATDNGQPAESSMRGEIRAAKEAAEAAKEEAKKAKKITQLLSSGVAFAFAALVYSSWDLSYSSWNLASSSNKNIDEFRVEMAQIAKKLDENQGETRRLIDGIAAELKALQTTVNSKDTRPLEERETRTRKR